MEVIEEHQTKLTGQLCTFSACNDVDIKLEDKNLAVTIDGSISLTIKHSLDGKVHCYEFFWESSSSTVWYCGTLEDSFQMLDSHWYGLGHVFCHHWPMEKWNTTKGPMVTGESGPFPIMSSTYYGGIQERLLFSSMGVGIHVDQDVPLFVSVNSNNDSFLKVCSSFKGPYHNSIGRNLFLKYHLCQTSNIKELWLYMHKKFLQNPISIPNEITFTKPVWSTWAEYKTGVNESKVLKLVEEIECHGFPCSHVEIDDDWTPHYGDNVVDTHKFPNMKTLVTVTKKKGYNLSLWIHPYVSLFSKTFLKYWKKGLLVKGYCSLPAVFSWWNGYAGLIDITNEQARDDYNSDLEQLKQTYGISSFKFDAGEGCQLSRSSKLCHPVSSPNAYSHLFAEFAYNSDKECLMQEIRVAYRNQNLPIWFRLQDKDSNWGYFNGIRTVIPHVLTLGLLGYPFVLPDMIGGNAYSGKPDRELYIRWVQLNALMPAMQFSLVPWKYDPEVIVIARRMCELHRQFAQTIIELAREATITGAPIIRPLWWIAPLDEVALTIDDEFLLGDDVLVAPVLERDVRFRDIYLPCGEWKDEISQETFEGGQWIKNYYTGLADLPHFSRMK